MNIDQGSCFQVITDIASYYAGGLKQPIMNPYLNATIQYSGKTWNDQGDVDACLRSPSMNFIEGKFDLLGTQVFQGICLQNVCTADWLNDNYEYIGDTLESLQIPISHRNFIFQSYPIEKPSTDNYGFRLLSIVCILIFALISSSLILRFIQYMKQKLKTKNFTNAIAIVNLSQQVETDETQLTHQKNQQPKSFHNLSHVQSSCENNNENINEKHIGSLQNLQENQRNETKQKNKESIIQKIIHCWDLKNNAQQLFNVSTRNPDLIAFDCLRVVSFFQVIIGHEYLVKLPYYSNPFNYDIIEAKPFMLFVYGCFYSVDIFLLLGGFFVAYVTADPKYREGYSVKSKLRMIKSFFLTILNRVLRIWPSFFFALYFYWQFSIHLGNSPLWPEYIVSTSYCSVGNWKNLLFINNLYNDASIECFAWGWYLSVDMQLFVFSIIFMIIYANNQKIGKIAIIGGLLFLQGISFYVSYKYNFKVFLGLGSISGADLDNFYYKSETRGAPYFLGLIFGVLYREYLHDKQNKQKKSFLSQFDRLFRETSWKWVSYIFGLFTIVYLVVAVRTLQVNGYEYWSDSFQNFYFGISRLLYAFGAIFVLLPSVCGSKDLLVRFMSGKIFQFIAKLSFSGYLIHYIFLEYTQWSIKDTFYFNSENMIIISIIDTMLTIIFAIFFVILIEYPFNNLTNIIFNQKKKQQIKKEDLQVKQNNIENMNKIST